MMKSLIYTFLCLMFLFSQGCKGCEDSDNKDTTVKPTFEYDVQKKDDKQAKKNGSDLITPEIDDLIWEDEQEQEDQRQQEEAKETPQDLATATQEETPEPSIQESEADEQTDTTAEPIIEAPVEEITAAEESTSDVPKAKETVVASKSPAEKPKKKLSSLTEQTVYKPVFSEKGQFIVQVASFQKKRNAVNLLGKLKSQGYPVFVDLYETDKGIFYRVRVGNFDTRSRAEDFRQKVLLVQGYNSSWVDTVK